VRRTVAGKHGMLQCGETTDYSSLTILMGHSFARGFATEMSVVEIFLGAFIVCDAAKFRRATILYRDDGSLTVITVEGSAYAAYL
jgi:hypothetical protein